MKKDDGSLKILFDGCDFVSRTGPNTFANRLARELSHTGHVIADPDDYDVALAFIEPSWPIEQYRKPVVQRLDGVWFKDEHEFRTKNVGIRACYEDCAHVVWQSEFDRSMVRKWFGERPGTVIGNGVRIDPIVDNAKIPDGLSRLRRDYEKIFVCSSNWHGQKRLKKNVELFRYLRDSFYSSSCLIVLGSNPDVVADPNIFYAGNVDHSTCAHVYAIADWMLHLAWLDHCPNVVTECLMQGTPVICSEAGGTKELVQGFGLILKERTEYNFELTNYDDPPDIDITQIASRLPETSMLGEHACIDIRVIAKQYLDVLSQVVEDDRRPVSRDR